jgi:hypothetical protein
MDLSSSSAASAIAFAGVSSPGIGKINQGESNGAMVVFGGIRGE